VLTLLPDAVSEKRLSADEPSAPYIRTTILQSIKKYSARRGNGHLKRTGEFWQHESYDHWVRDSGELERLLYYTLNNPVSAGLCSSWDKWQWTYLMGELLEL
jgi:hypothetical protein